MKARSWIFIGCVSAFLTVLLGAFGSHLLQSQISDHAFQMFRTAAEYQMFHSMGIILFGLWKYLSPGSSHWPGILFSAGILFFSGGLYALAVSGAAFLGHLAPIGGLSFLVGWLGFGGSVLRNRA